MTEEARFLPFTGDPERKVYVNNPPLELVLLQVRWPEHGRFARNFRDLALDFGEQLTDFPLFQEISEAAFQITANGPTQIEGQPAYQWKSVDDLWTVHLTKRFVSLYCTRHEGYSYKTFEPKLLTTLERVLDSLQVRSIERIGLRYVNRIQSPEMLSKLSKIFKPALLGFTQLKHEAEEATLVTNFNQAEYRADDVLLNVRTGLLGPDQTPDPAIPGVPMNSWVLDLDASIEERMNFDPETLLRAAGKLANTNYDFFRSVLIESAEQQLDGAQ